MLECLTRATPFPLTRAQMTFDPGEICCLRGPPSGERLSRTGRLTSAGSVEGGCVCMWGCQPVTVQLQAAQGTEGCSTDHIF